MDYSSTLNLPKSEFPMRANLPNREPEILQELEEQKLYNMLLEKNADKPLFILHDGPPFANGDIHIGHALNKILKDIVVKHKAMTGYKTPYIPGWDTHGLPIEVQAIKKLGVNRFEAGVVKFREVCRDFAVKYINNQIEQFKRLGVIGDFEKPYLTLNPEFEAEQIRIFGEIAKKGLIYKGLKPVYWCADCMTALAEAEIEYNDDTTNSIFVKFKVNNDNGVFEDVKDKGDIYFVIWTTTTWTLPGNVAISVNPSFEYSLIKCGEEIYVIATELIESVCKATGIESYEIVKKVKGCDLENIACSHPFIDRDSLVIVGDHVTLDAGTGCVHTAPGHGMEDFVACQGYNLPIIVPVDEKGVLNELAGEFEGLFYADSNAKIIERLKADNALLGITEINHPYPHCWRCKKPIIYRATEQWFASIDKIKDKALEEIKKVEWLPKWGEERISSMISERSDWCISRQRTWGVPIPIFYCADCKKPIINDETIKIVSDLFGEKGSDAWYAMEASEILPKGFACDSCGCTEFTKETDIMDVWFDSGSSHAAVLDVREETSSPADVYLEGNDQYRGWFQSSLITSVAAKGVAPYKKVITHGMTIDGEGKKMSKSIGNTISPLDVTKKYGADILRLWVSSCDYKTDIRISDDILKQMSEVYRKIRNTSKYILGNICDYNPQTDEVAFADMEEIDKFILIRLNKLTEKVLAAYENNEYHILYHAIHNFCVVDLSNFYLDVIKDRLYTEPAKSAARRSAQSAMFIILDYIVRLIAPVLAFTSEEIWKFMPHKDGDDLRSVILNPMPSVCDCYTDDAIEEKWSSILNVRSDVSKVLELARAEKIIGHSLNASVNIYANEEMTELLKPMEDYLKTVFITSDAKVLSVDDAPSDAYCGEACEGIKITVEVAKGEKCERCWMISETVGKNTDHPSLCSRCASVID